MNVITNNKVKCTVALAALQNVVDLGLIYQIDFDEPSKKIYCSMTLTTQFCPMGESITGGVRNALQNIFTDDAIEVELTFDPPWNHELISEEGQLFLNK